MNEYNFNINQMPNVLTLGIQGENQTRTFNFDCSKWLEEYPDGIVNLLIKQPTQNYIYLANTSYDNGILSFIPTSSDLNYCGTGRAEIRLSQASQVLKSVQFKVQIIPSITGVDYDLPEAYEDAIQQLIEASETFETDLTQMQEQIGQNALNIQALQQADTQNVKSSLNFNVDGALILALNNKNVKESTLKESDLKALAKSLEVSIDTTDYKITFLLKDTLGNTLSTQVIDLPLESVVVNGSYDSTTQSIILTLDNGNTITIPVGSLISGLASETYVNNAVATKLSKITTTTTHIQAYVKNADGTQSMIDLSSSVVANSIMIRDANGNVSVATPTNDNHATPKSYVDSNLPTIIRG